MRKRLPCSYRPGDRSCMIAGPGFDAAVAEIWSALVSGMMTCRCAASLFVRVTWLLGW